jgi:hypothetical protein
MTTTATPKRDDPILIYAGFQGNGVTFALHPKSRRQINEECPGVRIVPNSIFFSHDPPQDWERLLGPVWNQVATLLTGLGKADLGALGGVRVYDPESKTILHEWEPEGDLMEEEANPPSGSGTLGGSSQSKRSRPA